MAFTTYLEAANKLRSWLGDRAELNVLEGKQECTDDELIDYIKDAMNQINLEFEPITSFKLDTVITEPGESGFLPWSAVKLGATLQYLTSKGILSARNTLTYSDQGGVQVSNYDQYGRYVAYYNYLVNSYVKSVQQIKIRYNITQGYGGVPSPFTSNFNWSNEL